MELLVIVAIVCKFGNSRGVYIAPCSSCSLLGLLLVSLGDLGTSSGHSFFFRFPCHSASSLLSRLESQLPTRSRVIVLLTTIQLDPRRCADTFMFFSLTNKRRHSLQQKLRVDALVRCSLVEDVKALYLSLQIDDETAEFGPLRRVLVDVVDASALERIQFRAHTLMYHVNCSVAHG